MYGIVKGLGYVWVGFGLGGKDDENRKELGSYLRKFKIPFWSIRRLRPLLRRLRVSRRVFDDKPFWELFRTFFAFLAHLKSALRFCSIFFDFLSILEGF